MHRRSTWFLAASLLLVACGGSDGSGSDTPLEYDSAKLGVGIHHGDADPIALRDSGGNDALDQVPQTFSHAFLHVQAYDAHSWEFGSWERHPTPDEGEDPNFHRNTWYRDNPDQAKVGPRSADLARAVENAFPDDGFDSIGIVVDPWRTRADWYVRWDGKLDSDVNLTGGPDEVDYGFFRADPDDDGDMVDNLVEQIAVAAENQTPEYLVVGRNMERLLGTEEGPGIAPDDFSNFRQFYGRVVQRVSEVSPDTKVGAGFNWDRFARSVAPQYGEGKVGSVPPDATLEAAFRAVILPFVRRGDIVALESYRTPEGDASYYDFLGTLGDRFDIGGAPVVWYSIGSPVGPDSNTLQQEKYAEAFRQWNAGVDPEVVAWEALTEIDGARGANQEVVGRCDALRSSEQFGWNMPVERCFDGALDATYGAKEVFTYFREQIGNSN